MDTDVRFVYSLSSVKQLVDDAIRSIQTLLLHDVKPSQVVVYFTPPRDTRDEERLQQLGVDVRKRPNRTEGWSMGGSDAPSHYGDKAWLCDVDADRVVFFDCDTFIVADPIELFDDDVSFRARPDTYEFRESAWRSFFKQHDEPVHPWMPNAGVLVFQNRFHHEIADDWLHYISTKPVVDGVSIHREQYALALAVAGHDTGKLSSRHHALAWEGECPPDAIVHHVGGELAGNDNESPNKIRRAAKILRQGNIKSLYFRSKKYVTNRVMD